LAARPGQLRHEAESQKVNIWVSTGKFIGFMINKRGMKQILRK